MPKKTTGGRPELKAVNVGAAAIDIGSKMHMAAVNPASTDVPVRSFGTFTQDLHDLADWFKACGVMSVAMESTGVYWIPGATGMRIIRAIVSGERNPDVLATYRDVRCHSSIETIRAALVGNDRHEHVFALTQS